MAFKRVPRPKLTVGCKWANGYEVMFPVSYRYNGGIVVDDKYYEGFKIPAPRVPKGYEMSDIGCGLQLNTRPPYATNLIARKDGKPFTKTELKAAIKKLKS